MKGGFDLYGNYYENRGDALHAESMQMAEIDARNYMEQCQQDEMRYFTDSVDRLVKDYGVDMIIGYMIHNGSTEEIQDYINKVKKDK